MDSITACQLPDEVDAIFRSALHCRTCFEKRERQPALIDVAQPRWIGARYWPSPLRTVLVLVNPAAGKLAHDAPNREFTRRILAYRDGGSVAPVFEHQAAEIERWGGEKFAALYLEGFGLALDEIALVNIAWCAENKDRYSHRMLATCFARHTATLLRALAPRLILLSGVGAAAFEPEVRAACPRTRVDPVLHYAHRKGPAAAAQEAKRVRAIIALMRGMRPAI